MSFAASIATKSLKCARNARVANPVRNGGILSLECSSLESSMSSISLSPTSSVGKKSPSTTPIQAQRRRMSGNAKPPGKTRMTIKEIKAALEPITKAREQHGLNLPF